MRLGKGYSQQEGFSIRLAWWIIPCLIPQVNIVIFIVVWMGIAEARNKPNWWGILLIVPVASLIVPGYLAWAD